MTFAKRFTAQASPSRCMNFSTLFAKGMTPLRCGRISKSAGPIRSSISWSGGLKKHYGQPPQCVLMLPLLEGLDGVEQDVQVLGNYGDQ